MFSLFAIPAAICLHIICYYYNTGGAAPILVYSCYVLSLLSAGYIKISPEIFHNFSLSRETIELHMTYVSSKLGSLPYHPVCAATVMSSAVDAASASTVRSLNIPLYFPGLWALASDAVSHARSITAEEYNIFITEGIPLIVDSVKPPVLPVIDSVKPPVLPVIEQDFIIVDESKIIHTFNYNGKKFT